MRAVVQDRYGTRDVLRIADVPTPEPGPGQVQVRVVAASLHPDVWHVVNGRPYALRLMGSGLRRPRNPVPGTDLAGVVEHVGAGVTRLRPGDAVFGETLERNQWSNAGAFAEHAVAAEEALALKPADLSFEEAAATTTSALIALNNLPPAVRDVPGCRVLVNGAAGGVGLFALQIARAFGARVTGVDSTGKLDLLRALGADEVIDHTREDFTRGGTRYDVIVDIPGNHSFAQCRRVLDPHGTYVLIGHDRYGRAGGRWLGSLPRFFGLMARVPFTEQLRPMSLSSAPRAESMELLRELVATRRVRPVVDSVYPMDEVVEAMRHLEEDDLLGKVVLSISRLDPGLPR